MNDTLSDSETGAIPAAAPGPTRREPQRRAAGATLAVLEQLAALHPQLFGAVFLPLKRGIFQDLLQAHPDLFEREALKAALAQHTRSTRYLSAVASGQQRHDLQGLPVEATAPEHVHHALLEVFRRRQARSREDLRPQLRVRMAAAFEASGLTREAYGALVRGRDAAANQLLDEVLDEVQARAARDEALLRAFESGALSVDAFADMYGMDQQVAARALARARKVRAGAVAPVEDKPAAA